MADLVAVSSIITGVRSRIDDADADVSDATDILIYVKDAWKRLYSLYVGAEPDGYRTEATISSGAASQALPADWFSTIAVDFQPSVGTRYPLRRLQEADRNVFNGVTAGGGGALAYRVLGTNLCLYPTPSGGTYIHVYIPTAPAIADATTQLNVRAGHDGYLQKVIARELLKKEEAYDGRWENEIDRLELDLQEDAALRYQRDANEIRAGDTAYWDEADYRRFR
jgi:hypothetical protein